MLAILQKELNAFFSSLIAYVIIGFFLLLMGLFVWVFPETNVIDGGYADLQALFYLGPYVFIFLIPAITMHALAEEKKLGTLEVLLTTPLSYSQLILGKYLASITIIMLILFLTAPYAFSVYCIASPPGNIDLASLIGAYIGLFLLAAVFTAIGLLASSSTKHQLIAFLLGVLICFLLYQGFDTWATLQTWKSYSLLIVQLGIKHHYEALSRGVIDSRDLLYFIIEISLLLFATGSLLNYRR